MTLLRYFNATANATLLYLVHLLPGSTHRGVVRLLPDPETVSYLDLKEEFAQTVSEAQLGKFTMGKPIESTILHVISPDAVIHQAIVKMEALQAVADLSDGLGWCSGLPCRLIEHAWNPSIERFNGKFLFSTHLESDPANRLSFGWFNATAQGDVDLASGFCCSKPYYGIGPGQTVLPSGGAWTRESGDPRMLVLNDSHILVVYSAYPVKFHPTRMGMMTLRVNHENQLLEEVDHFLLQPSWLSYKEAQATYEKNWSPFIYNGSVIFAEQLDPLVVVSVHELDEPNPAIPVPFRKTRIFSQAKAHSHWSSGGWGDMRGGSPGRRIGKNRLLFFFHSRRQLPNNQRTTYFAGAFICTATPPFTMTHISRGPIYIPGMYEGAWDSLRFYDYVTYPTAWFLHGTGGSSLEELDECDYSCLLRHNITMIFGFQDGRGAATVINLVRLFSTMVRPGTQELDRRHLF